MGNPSRVHAPLLGIEPFGAGVYRLRFYAERRFTRFLPGQFLHLALDNFDPQEGYWPESRVFSICSSPRKDEISIVYSVKGKFTARMERELTVGSSYWVKLPYGDFIIDSLVSPEDTVVLVAGGTGISPYIPFLENEIVAGSSRHIRLVYGLRSAPLCIFDEVIERACLQLPNFQLAIFTQDGTHLALTGPKVSYAKGILNVSALKPAGDFAGVVYFLSGPPIMIDTLKSDLLTLGVSREKIAIDEWE